MKTSQLFFLILAILVFHFSVSAQAGDLDPSFGNGGIVTSQYQFQSSGVSPFRTVSAIQSDGKIVTAGVGLIPTSDFVFVYRFNPDGSPDLTFGSNGRAQINSGFFEAVGGMAIQTDGKIIISGERFFGTSTDFLVIRLNSDGSLDNTFDGNGVAVANIVGNSDEHGGAMTLQPDGKIVVVGRSDLDNNPANDNIAAVRFNSNGSRDLGFGTSGAFTVSFSNSDASATSVSLQSTGKIVIGGFYFNGLNNDFLSIRLNTNGNLDISYGTSGFFLTGVGSGNDAVTALEIMEDDRILVTGGSENSDTDIVVSRFTSNGSFDMTFGTGGFITKSITAGSSEFGRDILVQSDGKIVALGNSGGEAALLRLNADGTDDDTFGQNGVATERMVFGFSTFPFSLLIQPDGKLIASGMSFVSSTSPAYFFTARFLAESLIPPGRTRFDFDGDSKTDVGIFRPGPGEWWYLRSSDGGSYAAQFGSGTDLITPADFTGDGKADIAFFRPASGEWFILRSEDQSFFAFPFGANGDIPVPGDFDGDGKADPAVFRPSIATWFYLRSSDQQVVTTPFGLNGDQPIVEDYDGDGKDDLAVFRPSAAEWYLNRSNDGFIGYQFGPVGDTKPAVADLTGDGKADVTFFKPSSGEWFVLRSEDSSFFAFPFGATGDIPVPGDYDGDGTADPAVFRPSNNSWFLQQTTDGFEQVQFGITNDIPVPSAYITP